MKGLKELRESFQIKQDELAKMLSKTKKTIAQWEKNKSQPDISDLKDLALIFGTSVDDLLEYSKTGSKIHTTTYCLAMKNHYGFWGHVGIKISNAPFVWFPITTDVVDFLENSLTNIDKNNKWITFPTLVNQYVAFQPGKVKKVTFLDEAVDIFDDDWNLEYPFSGYSLELYRAFMEIASSHFPKEDAKKLIDLYSRKINKKNIDANEKQAFHVLIKKLKKLFNNQVSKKFIITAVDTFLEEDIFNEKNYSKYITDINVYYTNGKKETFYNNDDLLISNLDQIEYSERSKMIQMEDLENTSVFIPISKIAMITMPYITILDKDKEFEQDLQTK